MSAATKSSRHRSREVALQTLYAVDAARTSRNLERDLDVPPAGSQAEGPMCVAEEAALAGAGGSPSEAFESVSAHFEMPQGAKAFAHELVLEVCAHREELDERIAAHARNWRVARMPVVDRNILRLGAHELLHTETPAPVVLNEAVELARRFGADESPAFVNGVLAAIARELGEGAS